MAGGIRNRFCTPLPGLNDPAIPVHPPGQGSKTIFSFERNIYHPEYAIFQGGLINESTNKLFNEY
jgi:hypothetical protein